MRIGSALAIAGLVAAAACERGEEAPQGLAPQEMAEAESRAADELGPFGAEITGVAFWTHPRLPFNGLALVATGDGLVALNIEDGEEVSRADGFSARGVAVSYLGQAAAAQGYAVVSTAGEEGFRVYAIDNETRALRRIEALFVAGGNGRGFCLGRDGDGGRLALHQMTPDGAVSHVLRLDGTMAAVESQRAARVSGGFTACAADDVEGGFVALDDRGAVRRIDRNGKPDEAPLFRTGAARPAGIGLAVNGLVEGGPTDACCGQIAVLDGVDGSVELYDREDGRAIGRVRLVSSFDVEGVDAASALGVGSGNFGAIYRDGVLALATASDSPVVRLAPLNGVMDALGAPLGPAADPRGLAPGEDEDRLDFEIEAPFNP